MTFEKNEANRTLIEKIEHSDEWMDYLDLNSQIHKKYF